MINRDLVKYIRENWMKYLKYVSDISKGGKKPCSLVPVSSKMSFDFDSISEHLLPLCNKTTSVDMLDFEDDWVIFTEFKGGFYDKINRQTYVSQNCDYYVGITCPVLQPYLEKCRTLEKKNLVDSIVKKAIESYVLIHLLVLKKCDHLVCDNCQKLRLDVVIDSNPIDSEIQVSETEYKKTQTYKNKVSIENALMRFKRSGKVNVKNFYYDDVRVYDALEYEALFLKC